MRVLLADDQTQVRSALRLLLEQEPEIEIVGETADAAELLRLLAVKTTDVVLLDWELPGLPAGQLLRLLDLGFPTLRIIAMSTDPPIERQALAAGANAFLSKSGPPQKLISLMQTLNEEMSS